MTTIIESFYGLKKTPFLTNGSTGPVLMTQPLRDAVRYIEKELAAAVPILCVTGPTGIGKTSLSRVLPKLLAVSGCQATVPGTSGDWNQIGAGLMKSFGLDWSRMTREVIANAHTLHGNLLVVVDDADQLAPDLLERICILPQLSTSGRRPLLQVLLLTDLDSLDQEIATPLLAWTNPQSIHEMAPLPFAGTYRYIDKRLRRVGWYGDALIDEAAAGALHRVSGGNLKSLSVACLAVLERAAVCGIALVDERFVCETLPGESTRRDDPPTIMADAKPYRGAASEIDASRPSDALLSAPLTAENIKASPSLELATDAAGGSELRRSEDPMERPLESIRAVVRFPSPIHPNVRKRSVASNGRRGLWLCLCALLLAAAVYSGRPKINDFLSSLPIDIPFIVRAVDASPVDD
jgi:type II secretory pathway predicted ATPase ExeA